MSTIYLPRFIHSSQEVHSVVHYLLVEKIYRDLLTSLVRAFLVGPDSGHTVTSGYDQRLPQTPLLIMIRKSVDVKIHNN